MRSYKELLSLVDELNNDLADTDDFVDDIIKEEFKELITYAGDVAIFLEKNFSISESEIEKKELLDVAVNVIFDIHKKSPDTLENLLLYSGLEPRQISSVIDACRSKQRSEDKSICLLFESHVSDKLLINNEKNKSLLKLKGWDEVNNNNEDPFDAFVRHLIKSGTPSLILEQLARLTVYQKHQLKEHLEVNLRLRKIYDDFVEKGIIKDKDIEYARERIYSALLTNMNEYPIQIYQASGKIPVAQCSNNLINEDFLNGLSPSSMFDAWGVKNEKLLVYCVTNKFNFDSQDIQVIRNVYAIINGIKLGVLKDIKELEIHALCNPLISDENEEYTRFDEQIKKLSQKGIINNRDFNSLKYAPIHKEMLNVINNTSDDFYSEIEKNININFGFHSDNTGSIKLKDKKLQVKLSINNLSKAVDTLSKIMIDNPTLYRIDTAFSTYAKILCDSYCLAHSACLSYYSEDKTLNVSLANIENSLLDIKDALIKNHSRIANSISISTESKNVVERRRKTYNEVYLKEQESLNNNTIYELEQEKLQTAGHSVKYGQMKSNSKGVMHSLVLNGKYPTTITQSLLIDTLKDKLPDIKYKMNGEIKLNSYNQIKAGIIQGLKKSFNLDAVFDEIKNNYEELYKVINLDVDIQEQILKNKNTVIKPKMKFK